MIILTMYGVSALIPIPGIFGRNNTAQLIEYFSAKVPFAVAFKKRRRIVQRIVVMTFSGVMHHNISFANQRINQISVANIAFVKLITAAIFLFQAVQARQISSVS